MTLYKFDRNMTMTMNFERLSEAVTSLSQEYKYLSFDEVFIIKEIDVEDEHVTFLGDIDKAVSN